jgi:CubicO group peptidase (beta-lactamase class C family)
MFARFAHKVRPYPAEAVTTRNHAAEVEPRAAELTTDGVTRIWRAVAELYRTGFYPAVAFCLRRRGRVVLDGAIGHARGNAPDGHGPLVPATPATLFNLFSASKAITAMVIHLLDDRGLVHLDDAVAEYIPEFAQNGKEWITLRHVLTHRAGIPTVPGHDVDVALLADWDRIIAILCAARPVWAPGRRLAYHALTGGFILGEVVRRVTGRDIRRFLREEILDPLGFGHLGYGVAPEELDLVAEDAGTGPTVPPPISWLVKRSLGVSVPDAVAISNDPRFRTAIVPSGNIIGTADEACRFYQLLLDGGVQGGVRLLEPRTVRRAVAEQSYLELDLTLGLPVRYGMGFMLGGDVVSFYGADSRHAFGHVGFTNVITYADPVRDIAVALMTSGKPFLHTGLVRWLNVMRVVARECTPIPPTEPRWRGRPGRSVPGTASA